MSTVRASRSDSSNPAFRGGVFQQYEQGNGGMTNGVNAAPMTVEGTVNKTLILLLADG